MLSGYINNGNILRNNKNHVDIQEFRYMNEKLPCFYFLTKNFYFFKNWEKNNGDFVSWNPIPSHTRKNLKNNGVINATCHKSLSKFRNSTKPNTSALRGKNKRIQISISFAFKTGFLTGNVIEFDSEELHFQTLYNIF